MTMRATYGGLFSVINSREVNRLREILERCGLELGGIYPPNASNPMYAMFKLYENDFTQLPLETFVSWLKNLERYLSGWYRDKQKEHSETIRWSEHWRVDPKEALPDIEQMVNEDTGELKLASDCLTDLKRIRRNVEQRYRR